jgi:hypothetical protein
MNLLAVKPVRALPCILSRIFGAARMAALLLLLEILKTKCIVMA